MGFRAAKEREISPHFIIEVWGKEKSGKTRLGLTAPVPIYLYNFDRGYDRVERSMRTDSSTIPIEPSFEERYDRGLILVTDYSGMVKGKPGSLQAEDVENGREILRQFEEDWWKMVNNEFCKPPPAGLGLPKGGTAIIDTGTLIWNIAGHVLHKKAPPNQPWIQYTMRNDFFRRLLSSARDSGRNVIFIHHDTEIYGQEGTILGTRAQGDKLVARAADIVIKMRSEKQAQAGLPSFKTRIEDCGLNASVTGQELDGATFDELIEMVLN